MKSCSRCGNEIDLGAKFCSSCGQKLIENIQEPIVEMDENFIIKPVFNPIVVIGRYFLYLFIASFQIGGILSFMSLDPSIGPGPVFSIVIKAGLLAFIFLSVILCIITIGNYEKTSYEFLQDRLVYYDGFWNRNKKEIRYKEIKEIGYKQGILQGNHIGNLVLSTAATHQESGITLIDIENIKEVYQKFKVILDQNTR